MCRLNSKFLLLAVTGLFVFLGVLFNSNPAYGETLAIGETQKKVDGVNGVGIVNIFDMGTGSLINTISNPEGNVSGSFGTSILYHNGKIIISAPGQDNEHNQSKGAVYIMDGKTGSHLVTIKNPELNGPGEFGISIAAVGEKLIVGSPQQPISSVVGAGAVHIFDMGTGSLIQTISNPNSSESANFGNSVTALEKKFAVGMPGLDVNGNDRIGAVHIFDIGTGSLIQTLSNPEPDSREQFGYHLASKENLLLIGAPSRNIDGHDSAGAAYLFDGETGLLLHVIHNPEPDDNAHFGISLLIAENKIVVSANRAGLFNAGVVYVFDKDSGKLLETISHPDRDGKRSHGSNDFGHSLAYSDGKLVIGDGEKTINGKVSAGAVYVFDTVKYSLLETMPNPHPDISSSDLFGRSVAFVDDFMHSEISEMLEQSYTYDYTPGSLKFDADLDELSCDYIAPNPKVNTARSLNMDGMDDYFFIILGKSDFNDYRYLQMPLPDNKGIDDRESYLMDFRAEDAKVRGEFFQDYDQLAIYLETDSTSHKIGDDNYNRFLVGQSKNVSPSSNSLGPGEYNLHAILFQSDSSNWIKDEACAISLNWPVYVDANGNITPGQPQTQVGKIYPVDTDHAALEETDKIIRDAEQKKLESNSNDASFQFPAVYQIPEASFDKQVYLWGEQVNVQVVSPLDNIDSNKVDIITSDAAIFKFHIHTNPPFDTLENFILTETGSDTGVFRGTFTIIEPGSSDLGKQYLEVRKSTNSLSVSFEIPPDTTTAASAQFTYAEDPEPPGKTLTDKRFQKSQNINIQFRWTEQTSLFDGYGTVTLQYPSQNISSTAIDTVDANFISYGDSNEVFAVLTETGFNTGIFEGILPLSTLDSFSKLTLAKSDNGLRSIRAEYLVSDSLSSITSNNILLYNSLEYPVQQQDRMYNDSNLVLQTDKKAYLTSQSINVSGISDPNEIIHAVVSSDKGSTVQFNKVQADNNGSYETELEWIDGSLIPSGQYTVSVTSIKNDEQTTKQITVTSIEDLQSRSITVPPRQQSQMGLQLDEVVCKQVWQKLIKPGGEFPACVTLPTYEKLLERGWTRVI